jgi:hypothetical protein
MKQSLGKSNAIPLQVWRCHYSCRRLRLPEFLGDQYTRVARLSAPRTGRPHSRGDTHVRGWADPRAAGSIKSITPLGIEPITSRFVAPYLDQLCYHKPHNHLVHMNIPWNVEWHIMQQWPYVRHKTNHTNFTEYGIIRQHHIKTSYCTGSAKHSALLINTENYGFLFYHTYVKQAFWNMIWRWQYCKI